jgi:chorismate dehydratase
LNLKPSDGNGAPERRPRVAAVSYLNTTPLVWGMLHGRQRDAFDLEFCTPAECADRLENGAADIGIVPVIELERLGLEVIPGACIASRGPVRSILLISRAPLSEIRTLAADTSSRTSVALARIILAERYGVYPEFHPAAPNLEEMLAGADAALIIGDPALHIDPTTISHEVRDLGEEWTEWTGLPMVFAVWGGASGSLAHLEGEFTESARYGLDHIEEIVHKEAPKRGIPEALARDYLTHHVSFDLGEDERKGMQLFLEYAKRGVKV